MNLPVQENPFPIVQRHALTSIRSHALQHIFTDVLVIGSGIAGLAAALAAAPSSQVLVITKSKREESNTTYAQGGIAVVMHPDDSLQSHMEDTLAAGQGLCDVDAVATVIREGPDRIEALIRGGAQFDRDDDGLVFTREGGHSRNRVIHARGDATGREITRSLVQMALQHDAIRIMEDAFLIDLIVMEGDCRGAIILDASGTKLLVWSRSTILATGGLGQLYRETTNPAVATGDGMAAAYRAGALVQDMEFVQFHPTTLYIAGGARFLITEAIRGEGGLLRDGAGRRFMTDYHADAELAPRDAVSQAIVQQMRKTGDTNVFLDVTHLDSAFLRRRFPNIVAACAEFDIDITQDLIPVRPSAHYLVGGVKVDLLGQTGVPYLYACGEVAASGLHGANRLASNSLLEGLVFGHRAGEHAANCAMSRRGELFPAQYRTMPRTTQGPHLDISDIKASAKSLMWRNVGVERSSEVLKQALKKIAFWSRYVMDKEFHHREGWELQNMLVLCHLVACAALIREESRGVHFRTDFPQRDDEHWQQHITLSIADRTQ